MREERLVEEIPRKTFVLIISVFNKDYLEDQISVFQKKKITLIILLTMSYVETYIPLNKKLNFFKKGSLCVSL